MSRGGAHVRLEDILDHRPYRRRMREQSWLRVPGRRELFSGTFKTQPAEICAKRCIHFSKDTTRSGKSVRQILAHPRLLRALAWKEEDDVHRLESDDHRRPGESRSKSHHHHR